MTDEYPTLILNLHRWLLTQVNAGFTTCRDWPATHIDSNYLYKGYGLKQIV